MFEIKHDYTFVKEVNFTSKATLYADGRVARFRGLYNENYLYMPGDAVYNAKGDILGDLEQGGEVFIATQETKRGVPGEELTSSVWSPARPQNLVGWTIAFEAHEVFSVAIPNPTGAAEAGVINIDIAATHYTSAPESTTYRLKVINPSTEIFFPLYGTAFFESR